MKTLFITVILLANLNRAPLREGIQQAAGRPIRIEWVRMSKGQFAKKLRRPGCECGSIYCKSLLRKGRLTVIADNPINWGGDIWTTDAGSESCVYPSVKVHGLAFGEIKKIIRRCWR